MGVTGLATYLQENKRILAKHREIAKSELSTPLVIDAWSFIYNLLKDSGLAWVYGGEYAEFSKLVTRVVEGFWSVGIKPYFVFDGPYPPSKFYTAINRLTRSHVHPSLLFFRTSPTSRSSPSFLNESRILPPLVYSACVETMKSLIATGKGPIDVLWADNEGDAFAVDLASRVRGYVLSQDSDFVVLNSDGYLGYIPFEDIRWNAESTAESNLDQLADNDDSGFQTVKNPKKNRKPKFDGLSGRGIIPPDCVGGDFKLSLSVMIYTPDALSEHLKLPVTLLPLMGSLVGNDFSPPPSFARAFTSPSSQSDGTPSPNSYLFPRHMRASDRIPYITAQLMQVLHPGTTTPAQRRKASANLPQNVMELISTTVSALVASASPSAPNTRGGSNWTLGLKEQAEIVEGIVQATLPYGIPKRRGGDEAILLPLNELCPLHEPESCPLLEDLYRELPPMAADNGGRIDSGHEERERRQKVKRLYILAYRAGNLSPSILDIMCTGTCWPEIFLENPDIESVGRSVGRPLRAFLYAVIEEGTGLITREEEIEGDGGDAAVDEDDEIIDVVEEPSTDEDLDDVLQSETTKQGVPRLFNDEAGSTATGDTDMDAPPKSLSATSSRPQKTARQTTVSEYVRKGTRAVTEVVQVQPLIDFLPSSLLGTDTHRTPIQLQPPSVRLTSLLHFLQSDTEPIRALEPSHLLPVLCLRAVVRTMHTRSLGTSISKDRQRWTKREARAFLQAFVINPTHAHNSIPGSNRADDGLARDPISAKPNTSSGLSLTGSAGSLENNNTNRPTPTPISERVIQLTAQILSAFESIELIVQALLLTDRVPTTAHRFSGNAFHANLSSLSQNRFSADSGGSDAEIVWNSAVDGLEDCFALELSTGKGKNRKGGGAEPQVGTGNHQSGKTGNQRAKGKVSGANRGKFGLLASVGSVL